MMSVRILQVNQQKCFDKILERNEVNIIYQSRNNKIDGD
jgi:hypothetical protein